MKRLSFTGGFPVPIGPTGQVQIGVTGFEPATSWSQTTRSTKLSYTPDFMMNIMRRDFSHAETWPKRSVAEKFLRDAYHDMPLCACKNLFVADDVFSRSITLKK